MAEGALADKLAKHRELDVTVADRYLRKVLEKRPVATHRHLGDALVKAERELLRSVGDTDRSPEAVLGILRDLQNRYDGLRFEGQLLPHGSKKPSDSGGSAYWQENASGTSSSGGDQGGQSGGICWKFRDTGSCDKEHCPYRHVAAVGGGKGGKGSQSGKGGKSGKGGRSGKGGQSGQDSKDGVQQVGKIVGSEALPGAVAESPAVADEQQRGKSPPRRDRCVEGLDCQKSDCQLWHPSPGKGGTGGKNLKVTETWFMDVVSGPTAGHSLLATSASAVSKSSVSSVRELRWGPVTTKVVECTPEGEEAPECRNVASSVNMIMPHRISCHELRLRCVVSRRRCFRHFRSWTTGCLRRVKRVGCIIAIAGGRSVLPGSA